MNPLLALKHRLCAGFMLVEVLIALAIFGISAVFLVEGAFIASRVTREMKNTRELEQDLIWVRSEILKEADYDKLQEGGDIEALSMGKVTWEAEVEVVDNLLHLYEVTLNLDYEGNDDRGIDPGERKSQVYLLRPNWGNHGDFSSEHSRVRDDRREKMERHQEERDRAR